MPADIPAPADQLKQVQALERKHEESLRVGDRYFVVSTNWWRSWKLHVEADGPSPESVDNSELVDDSGSALRDEGVSEGADYVLKHESVWALLKRWYDATDEVSGVVREDGRGEKFVDVNPIRFEVFLADAGRPAPHRVAAASEALLVVARTTLGSELRKLVVDFLRARGELAGVSVEGNLGRLWVCEASEGAFSPFRGDVLQQELKDVLTGLGKWRLLLERRTTLTSAWPCGDTAETVPLKSSNSRSMEIDGDGAAAAAAGSNGSGPLSPADMQRRRGESFVAGQPPTVGQLVDAKRSADGRWHEAIVVAVGSEALQLQQKKSPLKSSSSSSNSTDDADAAAGGGGAAERAAEANGLVMPVRVHFLSFESKEDETLDAADSALVTPPHTHVPDWRAQLRTGEEVEVNRRVVRSSSMLTFTGTWLIGKVKRIDRQREVAPAAIDDDDDDDVVVDAENKNADLDGTHNPLAEIDNDEEINDGDAEDTASVRGTPGSPRTADGHPTTPVAGSPSSAISDGGAAAKPKRSRPTNFMRALKNKVRGGSGSNASGTAAAAAAAAASAAGSAPPSAPVGGSGAVLVEVRMGIYWTARKEVWVALDSEDVAQRYTHLARPAPSFGPKGEEGTPEAAGVVGLRNLGNTCFMNSMLQCLSFTEPLTDFFLRGDYEADLNRKNPLGTGAKLAEAYAALIHDLWSERFSTVAPSQFKQQLGQAFAQFQGYQQQDSHELLSLLTDGLHEDLNRVRKKPITEPVEPEGRPDEVVAQESWDVFKKRNDSVIVDLMMGLLRSHLVCPVCRFETVKFDPFSSCSVPIPVPSTVRVRLVLYTMSRESGAGLSELRPRAVRFLAEVNKGAAMKDVARWLSEKTGIRMRDLVLYELLGSGKKLAYSPSFEPRDLTVTSSYPRYGSQVKNHRDDDDLFAYELEPLSKSSDSDEAKGEAVAKDDDDDDVAVDDDDDDDYAKPAGYSGYGSAAGGIYGSSSSSNKKKKKVVVAADDEGDIAELRYTVSHSYECVRVSDVVRVRPGATQRDVHRLVWARSRFMFDLDALSPPESWLASLEKKQKKGSSDGDDGESPRSSVLRRDASPAGATKKKKNKEEDDDDDGDAPQPPYVLHSSVVYNKEIPCTDAAWKPTSAIEVRLTSAGEAALLFKPETARDRRERSAAAAEARAAADKSIAAPAAGESKDAATAPAQDDDEMDPERAAAAAQAASDARFGWGHVSLDETAAEALRQAAAAGGGDGGVDLMSCLDKFREREQLGVNDEWFCPKCKDHVQAFKQMDLWSVPEILVVHLKRFYYERNSYVTSWIDREKIGDLVKFPMEGLDLRAYVRGSGDSSKAPAPIYDLYGVSNHIGGMGGGHYTAYVRHPESGKWFLMDDSRVSEARPASVVSDQAYVLFYKRRA